MNVIKTEVRDQMDDLVHEWTIEIEGDPTEEEVVKDVEDAMFGVLKRWNHVVGMGVRYTSRPGG